MWQKIKSLFNWFIVSILQFFATLPDESVNNNEENLPVCSICYEVIAPIDINKLARRIKSDVYNYEDDDDDQFNSRLNISRFLCEHAEQFHQYCLWEWIVKDLNLNIESITSCYCKNLYYESDCPLCRQAITTQIGYDLR
jgi:hypothetical protein